ncbi:hypothetical protein [Acerihabitans arboris]|uniref:Uncharacterized protein n=1 Tax=Acerihabitans arboris TaxID=2691583 RepID=A0A845SNF5_9GAMM|nr:hypothetical protein [Acerihabitans arboris]NDL65569.1 hypothetical protein [Acerihabitans arboris]
MEVFLQGLYDRYKIVPGEENVLCINEDTLIYFSDGDNGITLLCPCFPLPTQQMDLIELLSLNCKSDINYCASEGIILAKLVLSPEDDFDNIMDKFGFYVYEIASAREYFGHGRRDELAGAFS